MTGGGRDIGRATALRLAASGAAVAINYRRSAEGAKSAVAEILECGGRAIAPDGVEGYNPAFDVTPAELVSAIVTERGVLRPPYGETLARLYREDG